MPSVSRSISGQMSSASPSRQPPQRRAAARAHLVGVRGDALAVEGGLRESALAAVQVAFAQEQPLADELARALSAAALEEVVVVVDEYVADALGAVDEEDALAADAEGRDVAVLAREFEHEVERVAAARVYESAEERVSLRPWRQGLARARLFARARFL